MSKASDIAAAVNKAMKEDVVGFASDIKITNIPTGVLPIDYMLGGGLPRGRFTEFFGDYSTLKSYVALKAIASAQSLGGTTAIIDTENAFDPEWAIKCGANPDDVIYQNPPTIEYAIDSTEALIRAGVDLIVWDSVAASLPQTEANKREHDEKHQPARLAAAMSRATRKLNAVNSNTALLWINQTRMKVGIMYGSPETTPGGKSLPFFASHRVAMRKAGNVTETSKSHDGYTGKTVKLKTGVKIRASLEKSKLTKPHQDVLFTFDLRTGEVDEVRWMVAQAIADGRIEKKGSMYWLDEDQKVKGIEGMIDLVRTSKSMEKSLRSNYLGTREHGKSKGGSPRKTT